MSLSVIHNTTGYQRVLDLINYTNAKNIHINQITITNLTELPANQKDAFGRNTSVTVKAVNNAGYRNLPPFQNGIVLKYRRSDISDNASAPKMSYDITSTTTWDQLTLLVTSELGVPRDECSNYTQDRLNEAGTAYIWPHLRANHLSVVIGTAGGYLGNGNHIITNSQSLLLVPSAVMVMVRSI